VSNDPIPFRFFNEIGIIEHLSRTAFERALPDGLSAAGFGVLNHFVRLGLRASNPARLARAFQVTKGAMTNTLQRLELLGYVAIDPDPSDGRGKVVRLTPQGRAAGGGRGRGGGPRRVVAPLYDALKQHVSEDELAAVLPVLTRVRQILDAARET
jgi:DNA-binding MarR family transcriptional regulator